MDSIIIDSVGIDMLIEKIKLSSPGEDAINPKFLKNAKTYSSTMLSMLFSQSLDTCELPSHWKVRKVVPLHKAGDTHSPGHYWPISLTSIPCKLMEHVIYSQ